MADADYWTGRLSSQDALTSDALHSTRRASRSLRPLLFRGASKSVWRHVRCCGHDAHQTGQVEVAVASAQTDAAGHDRRVWLDGRAIASGLSILTPLHDQSPRRSVRVWNL